MNLTEYLESEGKEKELAVTYGGTLPEIAGRTIEITKPLALTLKITGISRKEILMEGDSVLHCRVSCDRCLSDVDLEVPFTISERIREQDILEPDEDFELTGCLEGYELSTDRLLEEAIMTAFPAKVLCREDCKGICKVCGQNLNEGDCGCDDFVPDPRMAAIGDLFAAVNKDK
ncbi:MAG: DUF177 domain-containing protein [Lachnospiraceae bacterium]|nr:DUF177 domain-containing protein [Lachnospiraceae bacterium]